MSIEMEHSVATHEPGGRAWWRAVSILLVIALGRMAARGANLMWLHIPLGVAAVGLAGQAVASARGLGSEKGAA